MTRLSRASSTTALVTRSRRLTSRMRSICVSKRSSRRKLPLVTRMMAAVAIRVIELAAEIKKHQFNLKAVTGMGRGAGGLRSVKPLGRQKHTLKEICTGTSPRRVEKRLTTKTSAARWSRLIPAPKSLRKDGPVLAWAQEVCVINGF
jgi:hypothetical protein